MNSMKATALVLAALAGFALAACGSGAKVAAPHPLPATPPTTQAGCVPHCTPAVQPALDAAANYAENVAGDAHRFAGVEVDDPKDRVIVYLTNAPQSVIDQLNARHPGTYVIHNDAPRTLRVLTSLQHSFNFDVLKPEGIQVVSVGPTVDGFLRVGVTSKVAVARAKLEDIYGPNLIRVVKTGPVTSAVGVARGPVPQFSAVRSTQASPATPAEARQWRKKPIAVADGNDLSILHFVLRGGGCKPKGVLALRQGATLRVVLKPTGRVCSTQTRLYEVGLTFAKPLVDFRRIKKVVAVYGGFGHQRMSLAVVIAG